MWQLGISPNPTFCHFLNDPSLQCPVANSIRNFWFPLSSQCARNTHMSNLEALEGFLPTIVPLQVCGIWTNEYLFAFWRKRWEMLWPHYMFRPYVNTHHLFVEEGRPGNRWHETKANTIYGGQRSLYSPPPRCALLFNKIGNGSSSSEMSIQFVCKYTGSVM